MPKQSVRTGPSDDDTWDTEVDYEDQFRIKGAGSNAQRLDLSQGIFYLGTVKYFFPGGNISLIAVANGTYDLVIDTLLNVSFVAVGAEAANQFSLYRCLIQNNRCVSALDIRVGQVKPGAGGGGGGVDTQNDSAPIGTPATTIDFQGGIIASGGATTAVNVDWEDDNPAAIAGAGSPGVGADEVSRKDHVHPCIQFGAIPDPGIGVVAVGPANVDGVSPNYARVDHEHEGVHSVSVNGGAGITGDVDLVDGTDFTFTDIGGGQIQGDYTGPTAPSPGAGILPVGPADVDGVSGDFARVDHEHEGVSGIGANGGAVQSGDIDLIDTATVTVNDLGGGQFSLDGVPPTVLPGGGDQEKPWDYHELLTLLEPYMDTGFANNGMPSQRCVQMIETDDVKKLLILWHNGGDADDFLTSPPYLELTTVIMPSSIASNNYRLTVWTDQITGISELITENALHPYQNDFCLVTQEHAGIERTGNYIHILFRANDPITNTINIYDACFLDALETPFSDTIMSPSATLLDLALYATRVNGVANEIYPCQHVSGTAANNTANGPSIVVTWSQKTASFSAVDIVLSACFDNNIPIATPPYTQVTFQRDCIVSKTIPAPAYAAIKSTIECTDNNLHCSYCMSDGIGLKLWYSNTAPTYPLAPQASWDNVGPIDVESLAPAGLGLTCVNAPTMVVLRDATNLNDQILVVIADGTLIRGSLHWYLFDETLSVGPPAIILDGYTDLFDRTRDIALGYAYQLGLSDRILAEDGAIPYAYLYRTMHSEESSDAMTMDFVLQYMNWIIPPQPNEPWALVPIICGQADRVPDLSFASFYPKVHYSDQHQVRAFKPNDGKAWFPINIYQKLKINTVWNVDMFELNPERVMIVKDIPPYLFGPDEVV